MSIQPPDGGEANRTGPFPSEYGQPPPAPLPYARRLPQRQPTPPDVLRRRLIGTFRQFALAIGLALFAFGLGDSIIHQSSEGPGDMAIGGFLTGMAVTLRRGDRIW